MASSTFDIIEYLSGLTTFVLDESILKRIALDRGVSEVTYYSDLTEEMKDLCKADILHTVYYSGKSIASYQHQHGQFSESFGKQEVDKDAIFRLMMSLYRRWGDPKAELEQESDLKWIIECD